MIFINKLLLFFKRIFRFKRLAWRSTNKIIILLAWIILIVIIIFFFFFLLVQIIYLLRLIYWAKLFTHGSSQLARNIKSFLNLLVFISQRNWRKRFSFAIHENIFFTNSLFFLIWNRNTQLRVWFNRPLICIFIHLFTI